ncbi:M28 family peptidase [Xanthomarina sp. F2636L]|uniref:M28 family peptidase n=1 Tax=Xanthomarina sp. F2636L TaxID=2996018 RepID=UPI00225DF4E8|nr:M28 family peptidase [Xanthomarina sp. F2636L]MCX7551485.1 M28 family peptidase [Xanthomarina sp. F2636L]
MFKKAISIILIIAAIYWSFSALLPSKISTIDAPDNSFSTQRALIHLKEISKKPHYVGSPDHERVRNYLVTALENLGLETEIQEGYILTDWGTITKPKNILARIKGSDNSKALLLLSHYDSKSHTSLGASDAGSGVVTIIEGLRAYLHENRTPKNDLIILFSDAEELGLNGASLFVNKHPWAKDIGLVLNFEARGSGGPSYMLMETNGGNKELISNFIAANPEYPVANSLAYSVYKKLPNDTDLTRFREDGNIDGFNFAFIDDHFDYHTALDSYERLDRNTLEHQGSYLMPLLNYFSDADLSNLNSNEDNIYFNVPLFKTISYPFSWITPMLILAFLIFIGLIFYGLSKRTLHAKEMGKGTLMFLAALITNGIIGFYGWKFLLTIYPDYTEILHGFTYNGHTYIWMFSVLSLGICFWLYHKIYKPENTASLLVGPIFIWIIICVLVAFELPGASFFIIPVFFGLISLFVLVRQKQPNFLLMVLLTFPVLTIMSPFIKMFPVGLGLKLLLASSVLVTLIFGLLLTVFGSFRHKNRWSYVLFLITISVFISAHLNSSFNDEHPKPNSLVYYFDTDINEAVWATYDNILDPWTEAYLTKTPDTDHAISQTTFGSKYNTRFNFSKKAHIKPINKPYVDVQKDTIIGEDRHLKLFISPQRHVHRMDIYADSSNVFTSFNVNGLEIEKNQDGIVFSNRDFNRLFEYYVVDEKFLVLNFTVPKNQKTSLTYYESSFDILNNELFRVPERPKNMIPKPFVLNDAVMLKKTIVLD